LESLSAVAVALSSGAEKPSAIAESVSGEAEALALASETFSVLTDSVSPWLKSSVTVAFDSEGEKSWAC